jgi:hypothetical protein
MDKEIHQIQIEIKQKQFELQLESESTNGSNLLNSSYATIEQDLTFQTPQQDESSDEEPTPFEQTSGKIALDGYELEDRASSTFSSMSAQTVNDDDDSWYALREKNNRIARLSSAQASCNSCNASVDGKCLIF